MTSHSVPRSLLVSKAEPFHPEIVIVAHSRLQEFVFLASINIQHRQEATLLEELHGVFQRQPGAT